MLEPVMVEKTSLSTYKELTFIVDPVMVDPVMVE